MPDRVATTYPAAAIDAMLAEIRFDARGLVPAIAQQHDTGEILMMAWMDRDAVAETVEAIVIGGGFDGAHLCGGEKFGHFGGLFVCKLLISTALCSKFRRSCQNPAPDCRILTLVNCPGLTEVFREPQTEIPDGRAHEKDRGDHQAVQA